MSLTALPAGSDNPFVLLDDASPDGSGRAMLFRDPVGVVRADSLTDVLPALAQVEAATNSGLHAAGYLSYAAGHAFEPRLAGYAPREGDEGPLLWFGLPAFKSATMSTDMLAFNDMYRAAATEVEGEFVDIWDGFVDENGAFTTVGPDMNGQRGRQRVQARDVSLALTHARDTSILNVLPATVQALADDGPAQVLVSLALGGTPLLARITRKSAAALALAPGQRVFAQIKGVAVLD